MRARPACQELLLSDLDRSLAPLVAPWTRRGLLHDAALLVLALDADRYVDYEQCTRRVAAWARRVAAWARRVVAWVRRVAAWVRRMAAWVRRVAAWVRMGGSLGA